MAKTLHFRADRAYRQPMATKISSHEPATGALLWEGESGDVASNVARALAGWRDWAALSHANRVETVRRFVNALRAEEVALADLMARETGMPLWEAVEEIASVFRLVDVAIATHSERTGRRRLEGDLGSRHQLQHRPHGLLAVITPHCRPVAVPARKILAGLLAGNAVLFKPSEHVPATGAFLTRLFHRAGVPEDVLQMVPGGPDEGKALIVHPGIAGMLFTGSIRNGLAIHKALAGRPDKLLALEMGGNNPIVVWATGELQAAAAMVVQSAFARSGQDCMSARRLIVAEDLAAPLIGEIGKLLDRLIIDQPLARPAPFMGPVISDEAADALGSAFLGLMEQGGRPIRHLARPQASLPFLTPAIIDVTASERRSDAELFGPILQMIRVTDFDSAIAQANASHYGLCGALIGGSPEQFERFAAEVRCGILNWNRPTDAVSPAAPRYGLGLSGNHQAGGSYCADLAAHPIASAESEQVRAVIGVGLRPVDVSGMGD